MRNSLNKTDYNALRRIIFDLLKAKESPASIQDHWEVLLYLSSQLL